MGSLHVRKLVKLGHSIVVCLPPGWLAWNDLKQGDKVRIVTNGKLTIEAEIGPKDDLGQRMQTVNEKSMRSASRQEGKAVLSGPQSEPKHE
jgi:antitoxin component of MazEF toxin-antitoxin module